jgi:hypothetical protein
MTLIGLDLNATRARAVHGPVQHLPVALPLEGGRAELPLALSLEGRHVAVGHKGAALRRKMPDLACLDFLPHLGEARTWAAGRHRLDAAAALGLVFDHLRRTLGKGQGLAVALPGYLTEAQAVLLARVAEKARLGLLGTTPAPVAATLAAHEQLPWSGLALVADVDDHAFTWSLVAIDADQARLLASQPLPHLSLAAWLRRLLDQVANRCVRLTRRDPRESADAEQALYDQLLQALETRTGTDLAELAIQTDHWYQHLVLHPDELTAFCAPLVRQALAGMEAFLAAMASQGPVGALLVTAPAARLPGLTAALEDGLQTADVIRPAADDDDFGEDLLLEDRVTAGRVHVLDPDALARAAHDLAVRLHRGGLPRGHLGAVPLSDGGPADAGPARLQFDGQDYMLSGPVFTLGRDPACHLVFDSARYPTVSARHCEVVFDRGAYALRDRSRHGTLVNDRPVTGQLALHPGDWIRLGPDGPVARFLGQATDQQRLVTTA